MKYKIVIIFDDESIYQGIVESQDDIERIPKKFYETIRIFYPQTKYSHVLYGWDYIYLKYDDGVLSYFKYTPPEKSTLIRMNGVGKETEEEMKTFPTPTLIGKQLPDKQYEKIQKRCHEWVVD